MHESTLPSFIHLLERQRAHKGLKQQNSYSPKIIKNKNITYLIICERNKNIIRLLKLHISHFVVRWHGAVFQNELINVKIRDSISAKTFFNPVGSFLSTYSWSTKTFKEILQNCFKTYIQKKDPLIEGFFEKRFCLLKTIYKNIPLMNHTTWNSLLKFLHFLSSHF